MSSEPPAGTIAILKDDLPPSGAASSPDHLGGVLRHAGFATEFVSSGGLANAGVFNRSRFDVVVLPYGASFPVDAAGNFRKFLRAGGKFFSTGGYAFDNLLVRTTNGWRAYQPPPAPRLDGAAWFYEIPAAELRGRGRLSFHGFLKASEVAGPGFAYFSVYQVAADGSLPTWRDLCQVRGTTDWTEHRFAFDVHPQAATVSIRAGMYRCRGSAWFDDVRLTDEKGAVLLEEGFEEALKPDRQEARNWWRSSQELCNRQGAEVHSGSNAVQVKLGFEIPRVEVLNTRHGRPEDGLEVEPGQLGVFQADYPIERAVGAVAAPMQSVVPSELRLDGKMEGWAACGVVGWEAARWVPLVNTLDRYGRPRGAAGAMLRHYSGTWAGSSWAYFGVTNRDLFAPGDPGMDAAFARIIRSLVRDTYFASLTTEHSCYRQGESVKFSLPVFNGGRKARDLRVALDIFPGELDGSSTPAGDNRGGVRSVKPLARLVLNVRALPGQTNAVSVAWSPKRFGSNFYHVAAHLEEGAEEVDVIESGFIVQDAKAIASGQKLRFRDNYLRNGKRPLFHFGTDDWGYVFNTTRETPLQWRRDMRQRRDLGVQIYENLQFPQPSTPAQQESLFRKVDGIAQLSQQFGQVYFAGLLIGCNAAAGDAELASQRAYCRSFAERYSEVPGLIYYLNGDYRCELSEAVTPQWNEFLRQRYGSDGALRAAWGKYAPSQALGAIPSEDYHDWEQTWDDVSAYDRNCFRAWLIRRWNGALISGIREHDSQHPTSGEFYQVPHSGVDLLAGIDGLDLANFGFFEKPETDLAKFPALCVYNDQRARGKSGGPGEYGVKTHPAWGDGKDYGYHIARTPEQALEFYLAVPHYALGLGASRIHNWCWKDDAHRVFPWGMVYPCDGVPKEIGYAHRNLSLLFRQFAPVYETPQVYVFTADSHRMGGGKWKVIDGILAGIDIALAAHTPNLGTLNEQGLTIPREAKAIFYPLPFCPPDDVYSKLVEWVKAGGVLYLSGDISYDEQRRRSRTARLTELCGVRFQAERYPNIAVIATNAADQACIRVEPAGAEVIQSAADGSPLVVEHRVGRGRVIYTTDPVELHSTPERRGRDLALYRRVLKTARVEPITIVPDEPGLHIQKVPLRDGGAVWIVFNTYSNRAPKTVVLAQTQPAITVTVERHRPALVWFDGSGALRAVESQGACWAGKESILLDETRGVALSLDGKDLCKSRAVLLMPQRAGEVRWQSVAKWRKPVIQTGEISGGAWRGLETQGTRNIEGSIQVQVSEDQAWSLVLVCEESALPQWREAIGRSVLHPETIP